MRFEDKIRLLACVIPFSVTSWIRSRKHNAEVSGVDDSRHLLGLAVDIVFDEPVDRELFLRLAKSLGLQVITEIDHYHVQEPRE